MELAHLPPKVHDPLDPDSDSSMRNPRNSGSNPTTERPQRHAMKNPLPTAIAERGPAQDREG